jgi:glycosyl transferase, family 25
MKTPIEDYFDKIIVLTLARRTDRWKQMEKLLFEDLEFKGKVIKFYGYDKPADHSGNPSGNKGCTESHRAILEIIAYNDWGHVLVLEDDCQVAYDSPEKKTLVDPQKVFASHIGEVPVDYDILYLGGSYGSNPQRRISSHVIKVNTVLTTSSYAITAKMARKMAPHISGVGPIDSLFGGFTPAHKCYMFSPRLFTQGRSRSDLTDREDDNSVSMLDSRHEEMLVAGAWRKRQDGAMMLDSEINRREIAAPTDLNGTEVIVDGVLHKVVSMRLPAHPAPWRRGESCSYELVKA